jgi:hypothetical protein
LSFIAKFLAERRRLYDEWARIESVQAQARALTEELRRRRDGQPARYVDLSDLREAIADVHGTR